MRQLVAVLAAAAAGLVAVAPAGAGGWATVTLDPMPAGLGPGDTWRTDITFLQHGRTPLTGIHPTVTITDAGTGATHAYPAAETKRPGVYAAEVVFPAAGRWNVEVTSDWWGENRLTFGPVAVEGTPLAGGSREVPLLPAAVGLVALVAAAAGALLLARQRRLSPAR